MAEGADMRGFCVWFTGLPGSGKSTVASALTSRLRDMGYAPVRLDGDDVRKWLAPDADFSNEGRHKNIMRVAGVARLIVESRGIAIVSLVSPLDKSRREAHALIGSGVVMVFLLGRHSELWENTTYEPPEDAYELNTGMTPAGECAKLIIDELELLGLIALRHSEAPSLRVHIGH